MTIQAHGRCLGGSKLASPQISKFIEFCGLESGVAFFDHAAFERWAIDEYRSFWRRFLDWTAIDWSGSRDPVCVGEECETAVFFPELKLNYAQVVLSQGEGSAVAITAVRCGRPDETITRLELRRRVLRLASHLERLNIRAGDRVVAIVRNRPEAVVAALAAAAIGATFSSCSPDMGTDAILSRFEGIGASLLLAHVGAEPWDGGVPVRDKVEEVARQLLSLRHLIVLDSPPVAVMSIPVWSYDDIMAGADTTAAASRFAPLPFNHPLFIMFSSGTTGRPKCIVHGAGGTLLEHLKEHRLHCDLREGDRLHFYTSCAWMMWNWQLTALASGAEIVLYDGPVDGPQTLWKLVARLGVTVFGTSPTYLQLCERMDYRPREHNDFHNLRSILSTGSILHDRQFDWVSREIGPVPLQSISGGTDILGCFVLGLPLRPVSRGEAQSRSLALDVRALDPNEQGIGDLICANPFPSRPLGFLGDDGSAFHASYFSQNPPYWTHGDLIEFTSSGGARLHGRSDDVLNIKGIRIGPAELYSILKRIGWIADALAVETRTGEGEAELLLLVVLTGGKQLTNADQMTIRQMLHEHGSAALVPARCVQVLRLPETFSGKKSEAAVRDLANGRAVRNAASLKDPDCLDEIAAALVAKPPARVPLHPAKASSTVEAVRRLVASAIRFEIGADDNFLRAGADSLAIVEILLGLEGLLGRTISIDELIAAPTARDIAEEHTPNDESPAGHPGGGFDIRPAQTTDVEAICSLLGRGFKTSRVSIDNWRRLLTTRWVEPDCGFGYVLVVDREIVGFVGTLYSNSVGNGASLVCNLTSWYVDPSFRGFGSLLLASALRESNATFTSLTPAAITEHVLRKLGFQPYARLAFFGPSMIANWSSRMRPSFEFDPERVEGTLSKEQRHIFRFHQLPGLLHLVVSDSEGAAYVVVKRRTMPWRGFNVPVSEILYASDYMVVARHFRRLVLACLARQRTVLLALEDRFAPEGITPLRMASQPRYSTGSAQLSGVQPSIFSELALLDI